MCPHGECKQKLTVTILLFLVRYQWATIGQINKEGPALVGKGKKKLVVVKVLKIMYIFSVYDIPLYLWLYDILSGVVVW